MDSIDFTNVQEFTAHFLSHLKLKYKKVVDEIAEKKELSEGLTKQLESAVSEALKTFKPDSSKSIARQEIKYEKNDSKSSKPVKNKKK